MKFKIAETLEQDFNNTHADKITEKLEDFILKNCQPYLRQNKTGLPLYRGIGGEHVDDDDLDDILIKKVRKNRQPKDTADYLHIIFDEAFKKRFGWGVRSQGLFATGCRESTKHYGAAYIVFPIGDFSFVFSPEIGDLYVATENLMYDNGFVTKLKLPIQNEAADNIAKAWMATRTTGNNDDRWLLLKKYPIILDTYIKKHYTDKNFTQAVKSKNEISIRCDKYLAVKAALFPDKLIKKFFPKA